MISSYPEIGQEDVSMARTALGLTGVGRATRIGAEFHQPCEE